VLLPVAEFVYNNSVYASIGTTPFFALYDYYPEFTWDIEDDISERGALAAYKRAAQMKTIHNQLQERLRTAVMYQEKYYNNYHKPQEYNMGDLVLLSSKNIQLA
jgi:hypothetical protein